MKTYFIPLVILVFITGTSFQMNKNAVNEKEAIKKVINEATEAYRTKNLEKIEATWCQFEPVVKLRASKNGFNIIEGRSEINTFYEKDFNFPFRILGPKYEKVNFRMKVYKESAWVVHDEIHYNKEEEQTAKQIITHFLEKENGEWKVVYMSQIFTHTYEN